jgi:hypothetical protein
LEEICHAKVVQRVGRLVDTRRAIRIWTYNRDYKTHP